MGLQRNPTDSEVIELAYLSNRLLVITLQPVNDSWVWPLTSSKIVTVKSIMSDLVHDISPKSNHLYSVVWIDVYPKKIKIFLWELSHGTINKADRLQRRMLHFVLSQHPIMLCVVPVQNFLVIHSFIAFFLHNFVQLCLMLLDGPWAYQTPFRALGFGFRGTSFSCCQKDFLACY